MAVTINDVAKYAGVSITTVSRVLNNNYPVKKETREKIEKAIEILNYKPNIAARSLITKRTTNIAVLVPGLTNLFFPALVETIEKTIKNMGYGIFLCNTGGSASEEKNIIENIINQVDGLVTIDPSIENLEGGYYDSLCEKLPSIIINGSSGSFRCNSVSYDEEIGTIEAFRYLYKLGHRNIAFLRGLKSFSYDIKERVYKEFLKTNNLNYENIIYAGHGNSMEVVAKAEEEMIKFLKDHEKPTAIFACNDLMAIGAMTACTKEGLIIPKDISIIGCDNTILASVSHPKLTSVDLNIDEIGETAARELVTLIENKNSSRRRIILGTRLVARESCSEPKSMIEKGKGK